jgi:uncharacterized membrane protein YhaH (DUF805 family)
MRSTRILKTMTDPKNPDPSEQPQQQPPVTSNAPEGLQELLGETPPTLREGRRPRYLPPLEGQQQQPTPSYSAPEYSSSPPPMPRNYYPPMIGDQVQDSIFSFSGRLGRLSFQAAMLILLGVMLLVMFVMVIVLLVAVGASAVAHPGGLGVGAGIAVFALIVVPLGLMVAYMIAFYVRRLHDMDRSGLWLFLFFGVGIFGSAATLMQLTWVGYTASAVNTLLTLYIALAPGTDGVNRYGPQRYTPEYEKILGWIYALFVVCCYIVGWKTMGMMKQLNAASKQALLHPSANQDPMAQLAAALPQDDPTRARLLQIVAENKARHERLAQDQATAPSGPTDVPPPPKQSAGS